MFPINTPLPDENPVLIFTTLFFTWLSCWEVVGVGVFVGVGVEVGAAVGVLVGVGVNVGVLVGDNVGVGMGVGVGVGVDVAVGVDVEMGVDVGVGSGVGTCSGSLMVRANTLSWSTCAWAVAPAKSTLVSSNSHAPS